MHRLARLAGYVALLVTPAALLTRALFTVSDVSITALGLGASVILVGGVTATVECKRVLKGLDCPSVSRADAMDTLAVVAAAGVAYVLSVHAGLGPVVGSALVGAAAGLSLPEADTAAYCGSFVGMASPAVFPSVGSVLVAGVVAGLAFVASKEMFAGFGGKLGTLALFGCATTVLLTGVDYTAGSVLPWSSAALVIPVAIAGAVTAVVLSIRYELGAVLGSALVGLATGLTFPLVLPGMGGLLATVAFCASFVGMSTTERLRNEAWVGLAGALSGVVFVAVAPAFAGAGGKLGTVAFISCVAIFGAGELRDTLSSRTL